MDASWASSEPSDPCVTIYGGQLIGCTIQATGGARVVIENCLTDAGHIEGTWLKADPRRQFVEGVAWWEFQSTGGTIFGSDRRRAEAEAERRYPKAVTQQ